MLAHMSDKLYVRIKAEINKLLGEAQLRKINQMDIGYNPEEWADFRFSHYLYRGEHISFAMINGKQTVLANQGGK